MNTLFILGNGFDLALGRKTKYEDYIDSENFKRLLKINFNQLLNINIEEQFKKFIHFINNEFTECKKQMEEPRWFDLETILVRFIKENNSEINHKIFENYIFPVFIKSINDFILNTEPEIHEIQDLYNDTDNAAIKL